MEHPTKFQSLGMVVLDELHLPSGKILHDVVGGSGAYIKYIGSPHCYTICCSELSRMHFMAGEDFPGSVIEKLEGWAVNIQIRQVSGKKSTRGLLKYEDEDFGRKTFRYVTEPLQPTPKDLETVELLQAGVFHFLASPENLERWRTELLSLRGKQNSSKQPLVVWEPAPVHCKMENRDAHLSAFKLVDIFSPNHLELAGLFSDEDKSGPAFNPQEIERYARRFVEASVERKDSKTIVVRAGEHGVMTSSNSTACKSFPSFYDSESNKIADTTGAGNMFLGAFAVALQRSGDLEEAVMFGSVAASFAVEQVGLPERDGVGELETWNGINLKRDSVNAERDCPENMRIHPEYAW